MTKDTKDINKMQLFFLIITLGTFVKIIFLPISLVEVSGRDSWLTIIFMLVIDIAIAALIFIAMHLNPDKTFMQILEKTIGRIAATIIMLLIAAFAIYRTFYLFSYTLKFMVANLYDDLPWNPFALPLVIFITYGTYKGLRAISRANQLFGYFSLIVMIGSIILFLINADFGALLPVMEMGVGKPAKGLSQYILGTGDYHILIMFMGRIKQEKGTYKLAWLGILTASLLCIGFSVAFYAFYDNIASMQTHGHILSDMAKSFKGSDTLARVDTLILIFWVLSSMFNLIIRNWAAKQTFADAFHLKDSAKNNLLCALPVAVAILFVNGVIFTIIPAGNIFFTGWYRWLLIIPINYVTPVLIVILSAVLKHKEKKNGGTNGQNAPKQQSEQKPGREQTEKQADARGKILT